MGRRGLPSGGLCRAVLRGWQERQSFRAWEPPHPPAAGRRRRAAETPWGEEIEHKVFASSVGIGPYIEVAFFHKRSRSLLVTDAVVSVPEAPPEVRGGALALLCLSVFAACFLARVMLIQTLTQTRLRGAAKPAAGDQGWPHEAAGSGSWLAARPGFSAGGSPPTLALSTPPRPPNLMPALPLPCCSWSSRQIWSARRPATSSCG